MSNGYRLVNEISEKSATRRTNTSASVIDHVITNWESYITSDIKDNTFSGQNTISIKMNTIMVEKKTEYHTIRRIDYRKVKKYISRRNEDITCVDDLIKSLTLSFRKYTTSINLRTRG